MKIKKRYILLVIIILFLLWIYIGNTALEINKYNIKSKKIPNSFDGYKIAQISDLHNAEFGEGNAKLIKMLKNTESDMIVITGDIVDFSNTDIDVAISFAKEASKIAPTYYVNGNHEAAVEEYSKLKQALIEVGVTVLENETVEIISGADNIMLTGLNDPLFNKEPVLLDELIPQNDSYKILLAHRPEYFNVYSGKVDLVFSGHAHGGQFIIPFVGGFVAPGQGFFPEYYSGVYSQDGTDMVVSRGLGNSIIPVRINNRPEIVLVELTKD